MRRGTADGFLDTCNVRSRASRSLFLLGDSFVESLFVEEGERFAAQLERLMPEDWRVLNGGYSGTTTIHLATMLLAKILPMVTSRDRIVFFIGQSDLFALASPGYYWDDASAITPVRPPLNVGTVGTSPDVAASRAIDALLSIADSFDLNYGVVAAPFRDSSFPGDPVLRAVYGNDRNRYERLTSLRRVVQQEAKRSAERHGKPFLDAQTAVAGPQCFYDLLHLNSTGQSEFTGTMANWLDHWGQGML